MPGGIGDSRKGADGQDGVFPVAMDGAWVETSDEGCRAAPCGCKINEGEQMTLVRCDCMMRDMI